MPPFMPFPPGYHNAQSPVPHVTPHARLGRPRGHRRHGRGVVHALAGTGRGPSFVTPRLRHAQRAAGDAAFLSRPRHGRDPARRVRRASSGPAYFIRDPNARWTGRARRCPREQFEIPLVFFDRAFFTDGELDFPRDEHQPRERVLAGRGRRERHPRQRQGVAEPERPAAAVPLPHAGRGQRRASSTSQLDYDGHVVPFTIIGSDGGYLPAPQVVTEVSRSASPNAPTSWSTSPSSRPARRSSCATLRRAPAGTRLACIMRFTVQDSTPVPPPALTRRCSRRGRRCRPTRRRGSRRCPQPAMRRRHQPPAHARRTASSPRPTTEFPLVGSTEQWDIVNIGGGGAPDPPAPDRVPGRQPPGVRPDGLPAGVELLNGHRPVTRPIVRRSDAVPDGDADRRRCRTRPAGRTRSGRRPNQVTRIIARWAPQETRDRRRAARARTCSRSIRVPDRHVTGPATCGTATSSATRTTT